MLRVSIHRILIGNWICLTVTAREQSNNSNSRCYMIHSSLWNASNLLSLLCLDQSSYDGFQWQTFPFLWVSELFLCLSHWVLGWMQQNSYFILNKTNCQLNLSMPLKWPSLHNSTLSKVKVILRPTVYRPFCSGQATILDPRPIFLFCRNYLQTAAIF
jgi:hypothetical protein